MIGFYKLALGCVTTLLLVFGSYYIKNVEADADRAYKSAEQLLERTIDHEQRITTLEESKRNTEQILQEIKSSIQRIENALVGRR